MLKIINKIKFNQSKQIKLFFEKERIGEEVKTNLVSISLGDVVVKKNEIKILLGSLVTSIDEIINNLNTHYPNQCIIFYSWFDQGEDVLRWTVVSDLNQQRLPFSSTINEVTINKIVENWVAPRTAIEQLPSNEIINMTSNQLRLLMDSLEPSTLDVFKQVLNKDRMTCS